MEPIETLTALAGDSACIVGLESRTGGAGAFGPQSGCRAGCELTGQTKRSDANLFAILEKWYERAARMSNSNADLEEDE